MPWYISEPEDTGWKLNSLVLVQRLQQRWPSAEVREITDPMRKNYSHEWRIRMEGRILDGKFDQGESGVVLDGDLKDAVAFASWFRSLVPREKILLFYDQGFSMHVNLKPGVTEREIIAAVGNV